MSESHITLCNLIPCNGKFNQVFVTHNGLKLQPIKMWGEFVQCYCDFDNDEGTCCKTGEKVMFSISNSEDIAYCNIRQVASNGFVGDFPAGVTIPTSQIQQTQVKYFCDNWKLDCAEHGNVSPDIIQMSYGRYSNRRLFYPRLNKVIDCYNYSYDIYNKKTDKIGRRVYVFHKPNTLQEEMTLRDIGECIYPIGFEGSSNLFEPLDLEVTYNGDVLIVAKPITILQACESSDDST